MPSEEQRHPLQGVRDLLGSYDLPNTFYLEAHQRLVDLFKSALKYIDLAEEDVKKSCSTLVEKYSTDLQMDIFDELMHLRKIQNSVFQQGAKLESFALLN